MVKKIDINSLKFGIQCNFPYFCGEERTKEALEILNHIVSELEKTTAERDKAIQRLKELEMSMQKGRFVILPCRLGDKVYTIDRDECPCDICPHGENYGYNSLKCLEDDRSIGCYKECPPPRYSIIEHICRGFTIGGDEDGNPVVSKPGEWGYEGLEEFYGYDGKVYYDYETAKEAVKALEANK